MEKDIKLNETATAAAVIDTSNNIHTTSKTTSPIVIKIETPKDATKPQQQTVKVVDEKVLKMNFKKKCSETNEESTEKPTRSMLCRLLPVLLFLVTFATVLSLLILFMDPSTEYRHQQFIRQNLTQDYDMVNTPQDNGELIWFVREVLMKKYPMPTLPRLPMDQFNYNSSSELEATMAKFIGTELFGSKKSGFYFQSLTGSNGKMIPAPWLTESLQWGGCIVEPDPLKYFQLRKLYARRDSTKIVHASLSPQKYPKEVTLHYEETESEVKVETMSDEPERIKCFPLYTILLALNRTQVDLLSLGCQGQELEILQTIPWDRVSIEVISIHLVHFSHKIDYALYSSELIKYLEDLSYQLVWNHERNFVFKKAPKSEQTRN
ncbi:hypothetical protein PVAND_013261 [Polypedilum vanderplanki]|uniref:Protein Star n=1 Tax=Polypedilum vanderplanki TaxID=319348 RepID=A0A9J6CPY2_POLVA|nr:hypothetical protein PVAND_013261 [Polypedilum vanderplanki]